MNFRDILIHHSVPHWTEGTYCRAGWIQFHCPFCTGGSDPNKPYCGYSITANFVNCWRCGPHNMTKTLSLLTGLSWRETIALAPNLQIEGLHELGAKPAHRGKLTLPRGVEPLSAAHKRYLRGRGFDPDEIERLWRVQGIGIAAKLSWRLFIPIYYHGEVVSWTTRGLTDREPRYISAKPEQETIPNKQLLYGEDFATVAISIHEGPTNVWRVGPGSTATMGVRVTPKQIARMIIYPRRIVCFDSEPQAQVRARRLCDTLQLYPGETLNVVLDANDAASARPKEIRQLQKMLR